MVNLKQRSVKRTLVDNQPIDPFPLPSRVPRHIEHSIAKLCKSTIKNKKGRFYSRIGEAITHGNLRLLQRMVRSNKLVQVNYGHG